jgi:dipeptidyl aminopeptidase/acylaminoacyl peptidase
MLAFTLLASSAFGQSLREMGELTSARSLDLSADGSRLWYQVGQKWWVVDTKAGAVPTAVVGHQLKPAEKRRLSPDGKKMAYIDVEIPVAGPSLLFCACGKPSTDPRPISRRVVIDFQWAADSNSLWVITVDGADEPVGRLFLDGKFEKVSRQPALRRRGGFSAANDVVAWVETDGGHAGRLWLRDRSGNVRMLVDPNPQMANWDIGTQEVVHWKNAHGEELQGILMKPKRGSKFPLVVDPYSNWRNGFNNIASLGNYVFVKEGFAVFFPDHRAPLIQPLSGFGEQYVGRSLTRDPIDVLVDDVMSGVNDLVRHGVANPSRMFLYSTSNGASAINQLLTETRAFRAAVSHAGVADWLLYYEEQKARQADVLIAGFLGERTPEDSLELYRRISPVYQADKIKTPLILTVGEKDVRLADAQRLNESLSKSGAPVTFVTYPNEGHEFSNPAAAEQHLRKAIEFFRDNSR